jgi:hypothetical protein
MENARANFQHDSASQQPLAREQYPDHGTTWFNPVIECANIL